MIAYRIEDMTCGGCVRAIRAAVARVAPSATVRADVEARLVSVDGSDDAAGIEAAIRAAGFAPAAIAAPQTPVPTGGRGCGAGACRCAG
jgi:copper chaperone